MILERTARRIAAFLLLAASFAIAQSKRPFTFEDMMQLKRIGDFTVSPDGKWVTFSAVDVSLADNTRKSHLWIVPLAGGPERRLTEPGAGTEDRLRFSPDGKRVLYTAVRNGVSQIYVQEFDTTTGTLTGKPLQVTSISTEADGGIWSPDGKQILFVSAVYPECKDDACNKAKDDELAKSKVKAQVFTRLFYRHWSSYNNGKRSHLFITKSGICQRGQADGGTREGDAVPLAPNAAAELPMQSGPPVICIARDLTPGDHDVPPFSLGGQDQYQFSPDGKEIAFTSNLDEVEATSTNSDVFTLSLTDPNAKPVNLTAANKGSDSTPMYSPDGKWIAIRSQFRAGYESDRFRLQLIDRKQVQANASGFSGCGASADKLKEKCGKLPNYIINLTENFDRWVDSIAWAPDSKKLYITAGENGESPIFQVAVTGGEPRRLEGDYNDSPTPTPDGKLLVFTRNSVEYPNEIFVGDLAVMSRQDETIWEKKRGNRIEGETKVARGLTEASITCGDGIGKEGNVVPGGCFQSQVALTLTEGIRELTNINLPVLAKIDMQPVESFEFTGSEKAKVQGFVVKPPNFDPSKKYPVKFLIHGGPQGAWGDDWSFRWNPNLFAANGYVVIMVNPRGSTGYGQKFVDDVNGDWGGRPFQDLMLGLDYAEKNFPYIDKDRECALGASYGGYMANWILGHSTRFKCIVSHDGMFNPESAWGTTEELWFNEWEYKGTPWTNRELYRKWSPMLAAPNFKTPTLVVHGQLDYRLDVSEGFQLFTTLQRLNVPSKMLYFPDEGHWVLKPQNSQLWYKTVNDWIDQWTKPVVSH